LYKGITSRVYRKITSRVMFGVCVSERAIALLGLIFL
jgi:hypothetical protein